MFKKLTENLKRNIVFCCYVMSVNKFHLKDLV